MLAMGEHNLDFTSRILRHLDRHVIFLLLEFLQEQCLYPADEKGELLLSQTNMVDIHKSLYCTEDFRKIEVFGGGGVAASFIPSECHTHPGVEAKEAVQQPNAE